jgi:leader peptidase (prepilin peptidase)/N-methyltransferase
METSWIACAIAGGWVWGSFLNTVIDRTPHPGHPAGSRVLRPLRSRCEGCGGQIAWHDLVPVLSYLVLRGRCRKCDAEISPRTVVVEILSPVLFGGFAWLLTLITGYPALGALAVFGLATLSWLVVAVPLLIEGRQPKPAFLGAGVGLFAALAATAVVIAISVMST